MSAREVEITCSSRGLLQILVDREELVDCSAIRDKLIPDWFKPARDDRSGWRGLIKEIRTTLADDEAELRFMFNGPQEQKHQFFNCLDEYGMNGGEKANAEEVSEARLHDAHKAALRGQSTTMLQNLMVAAELGNAEAMRNLAVCYRDGRGVDADYEKASEWLRKAAKAGDNQALEMLLQPMGEPATATISANTEPSSPQEVTKQNETVYVGIGNTDATYNSDNERENQEYENLKKLMDDGRYEGAFQFAQKFAERDDAYAQMSLGLCYLMRDTEEDVKRGVEWINKAAEQGYAEAQYELGECYYYGVSVVKDEYAAFGWYQKAAEQNDADAQTKLGDCYCFGRGTVEDKNTAFQWYRKAAEQGLAVAQNMLGRCYQEGWGTSGKMGFAPVRFAPLWYKKAAEQGFAPAQYNLASCYRDGIGIYANAVKAFEWYKKAANQGDADAQYELGDCYYFGIGVAEDNSAAFQCYQKAAAQDNAEARNMLGQCYEHGFGTYQDQSLAFKCYQKAAEQGLAVAKNNLADCYNNGVGVKENAKKAFELHQEVAEQGNRRARCSLGTDFALGRGVKKDLNKAEYWLKLAVEQKYVLAYYWLAEVIYAKNVRDELSYNQFYRDLEKNFDKLDTKLTKDFGDTGAIIGASIIGGIGGAIITPFVIGQWGYNALKSIHEKDTAKAFLKTETGQEMLSLYQHAADNDIIQARQRLAELQKYL